MELTLKFKQDILDLLEFVQAKKASENEPMADSTASKLCFGHGEYVGNLRKWDGGGGSPTLEKTLKFERFLLDQLDEKELAKFLKTRSPAIADPSHKQKLSRPRLEPYAGKDKPEPVDDWS